jgi:aminopeptidase N
VLGTGFHRWISRISARVGAGTGISAGMLGIIALAALAATPVTAGARAVGDGAGYAGGADNPSGGTVSRHALHARITTEGASLFVTDTLTIIHAPGIPANRRLPFLLARTLSISKATGITGQIRVTSDDGLRPRDYWESPPYDELDGYERARTIWIAPANEKGKWPERTLVVLVYSGTVYDSLRAPKAAYARGFESTSGLIDPRGAYLNGGTFWVPYRPEERFTFRCAIEAPEGWRGISQGALVGSFDSKGGSPTHTDVWDSPQPMEEIYLIGGPYVFRQARKLGVDVMTFTYADTDSALCRRYIDGTERYLSLYDSKIGPYPFAKFALIENFWQTGFGMPSFTLLGNQVIRLPWILDTSYGHEILHNWWGNGVNVDYAGGNWCEGLTTYGADYLYKEMASQAEAREERRSSLQAYADYVTGNKERPLRLFREREDAASQAIGYRKSMMVFHQVRRLLGDDSYWGALQDFYAAHLFRSASWDDLFTAFSKRAGRDLSGWKRQWIDRTGAPVLSLKDRHVSGSDRDGYTTEVVVAQTQPDPYDIRVPVRIGWANGNLTGSPVGTAAGRTAAAAETTQVIELSGGEAACVFKTRRAPDWVAVDPDFDVLRRIDPAEIPAAISRTLGADTAVAVVASGLSTEMAESYRKAARSWAEGTKLGIVSEDDLRGKLPDVPAWLLGVGPLARRLAAERRDPGTIPPSSPGAGWKVAGTDQAPGRGIVIAGGIPPRSWTLVEAPDADAAAAIARKMPHYGKYSYLVFDGGTNVAKGAWDVLDSPLRASLR